MKPACEVREGDRIGEWMVVESRPYAPNPEVMWFIFWEKFGAQQSGLDCSFVPRDMLIEIQYDAYEVVELP